MAKKIIRLYTDGAFRSNPQNGACSFVALDANYNMMHKFTQCYQNTTINRLEILGGIHALNWANVKASKLRPVLYTDSQYLNKMIYRIPWWNRTGWQTRMGNIVANLDLILTYKKVINDCSHYFSSYWIKGHSGDVGNELAHELAEYACIECDDFLNDIGGYPLISIDDITPIVEPRHLNMVINYCYKIAPF